ncbi:MAG: hypothetical protein LBD67_04385 [Candidatus Accumulibacter sp.]|nr:hypothetical protein [Accumulibacter sp.]
MLSLSKYERTLRPFQSLPFDRLGMNGWGKTRPCPTCQTFDRLKVEQSKRIFLPFMLSLPNCRHHLFPFVLSLSKQERMLQPFQSLPFDKLRANGLERRSSTGSK